jgi:hypothetical protein
MGVDLHIKLHLLVFRMPSPDGSGITAQKKEGNSRLFFCGE